MEIINPKPRQKNYKLKSNLPLPVIVKKDGSIYKFNGVFNGFSVVISDEEDMKNIVSMGYFGKANCSRSLPQFNNRIIRKRQFNQRKQMCNDLDYKGKPDKVVVVPDSDSENEDYFTNLLPTYEVDSSSVQENVNLSLEEAFFLAHTVDCLNVLYEEKLLTLEELWNIFSATEPKFQTNYVVYFYYRSKNWVVKPGLKFGGDYLLYKQGPAFFHASFVVTIEVLENNLQIDGFLDNNSLFGLNRLCETAGKELLVCRILWDKNIVSNIHYNNLSQIEIKDIVVKRWIASQNRNNT